MTKKPGQYEITSDPKINISAPVRNTEIVLSIRKVGATKGRPVLFELIPMRTSVEVSGKVGSYPIVQALVTNLETLRNKKRSSVTYQVVVYERKLQLISRVSIHLVVPNSVKQSISPAFTQQELDKIESLLADDFDKQQQSEAQRKQKLEHLQQKLAEAKTAAESESDSSSDDEQLAELEAELKQITQSQSARKKAAEKARQKKQQLIKQKQEHLSAARKRARDEVDDDVVQGTNENDPPTNTQTAAPSPTKKQKKDHKPTIASAPPATNSNVDNTEVDDETDGEASTTDTDDAEPPAIYPTKLSTPGPGKSKSATSNKMKSKSKGKTGTVDEGKSSFSTNDSVLE